MGLPAATERLSHGEPTWFVGKRVFTMFSNNHHGDGRIAIVLPFDADLQKSLLEREPTKFYFPPYVGKSGWIGIILSQVREGELEERITAAWRRVAPKRLLAELDAEGLSE